MRTRELAGLPGRNAATSAIPGGDCLVPRRGPCRVGQRHARSQAACRSSRPRMPAQGAEDQRPGAQVEVLPRDHDLILLPHVAVRLEQIRDDGTAPAPGRG